MEIKKCVTCKEDKSLSEYSKNKSTKDGLKTYCKKCASEAGKRYREKHREKVLQAKKDWYETTKKNKEARTSKALVEGQKECSYCGKVKDITDFYKRGNGGFYGECKDCHNIKVRQYEEENREVYLERKRAYYQKNIEEIKEKQHQYYLDNKEAIMRNVKEWEKNNPERAKELKLLSFHKRRTRANQVPHTFTKDEWKFCKDFFRNDEGYILCAYCNKEMKRATIEHFIPVMKYGHHTADNILPVCPSCNSSKQDIDFDKWYQRQEFYSEDNIQKIHEYFQLVK
ncbi:HNH endonuclease [Bacillus cereus]|nr:HNH endonuclease [Bacillus cereus]